MATPHWRWQVSAAPEVFGNFHDPLPEFPGCLKGMRRWVRWKLENGTKIPYTTTGRRASSTDPNTWTEYQSAVTGVTIDGNGGVGFVVDKGIVGFDLDGCRDRASGDITEWAQRVVDSLDSYTEITPSGNGLRVWVRGTLPEGPKVFNLNPSCGHGDKVKIEVFTTARYFAVTGDSYFEEPDDVEQRDLTAVYQMLHDIRAQYPVASKSPSYTGVDDSEPARVEKIGNFNTSKYDILMHGKIVSTSPFVIENHWGRISDYPSHSEAELGLTTILAFKHDGDAEKMDADFRKSALMRDKWERTSKYTIDKALATYNAKKGAALLLDAPSVSAPAIESTIADAPIVVNDSLPVVDFETDTIPAFDDSVITGIFRDVVDLVANGTTIPRQFPFTVAKVYFGARMAEGMTFEGITDTPTMYGTVIGETGTSKGLSWERTMYGILDRKEMIDRKVKVLYSLDSGAGLRDAFFDPPMNYPVIGYIDEVRSLGNKADAKKNPEIVDAIVELANGRRVSRQLAKKSKGDKVRVNETAYLGLYMCGQDGEAFMSSFPARTKMGLWDRFYPEYSPAIEAGELPGVEQTDALRMLTKISQMPFHGHMKMGEVVKTALAAFWSRQPKEIRTKVRFKSHLMLDMYFSAWSQGRTVAEFSDLEMAAKIFVRQMVIRRIHFRGEIPDRVGYYLGLFKFITERMRKRLRAGEPITAVAMSVRDFQNDTHAYRDNETHVFNTAWRNFERDHLLKVAVKAKNGQTYDKFVPLPYEDETWVAA